MEWGVGMDFLCRIGSCDLNKPIKGVVSKRRVVTIRKRAKPFIIIFTELKRSCPFHTHIDLQLQKYINHLKIQSARNPEIHTVTTHIPVQLAVALHLSKFLVCGHHGCLDGIYHTTATATGTEYRMLNSLMSCLCYLVF